MSDMTPAEAADAVKLIEELHFLGWDVASLRTLIDHARSTAAPGDLADAELFAIREALRGAGIEVGETGAEVTLVGVREMLRWAEVDRETSKSLARRVAASLDARDEVRLARERMATVPPHARPMWTPGSFRDRPPASEVAERPVEIVTAKEVRSLPRGSWVLPVLENGVPRFDRDGPAPPVESTHFYRAKNSTTPDCYAIVHRAPEPVAPPKRVGDLIETSAQLDALPVGAVVRGGQHACERYPYGWRDTSGWTRTLTLPARVLDLPTADLHGHPYDVAGHLPGDDQ